MDNIGKKVLLVSGGYEIDRYNPRGIQGRIVGLNPRKANDNCFEPFGKYIVEWSNGLRNSYDLKNLKVL